MAQSGETAEPPETVQQEPTTLDTVEVTGSHIRRAGYETAQPILLLDREQIERTGLNTLGEILQQLPQHGSDLNSDYNNGGNGETRVDLRDLGSNRTLVLVNGHRYVNTLDGAVDVGSIPLPIVDRIEILTDGASAVYGSDAIAGVVNVITRDDYQGAEFGMYYASSEHGDGQRRAADLSWGRNGEHGNLALNLSFADQQPIWARDRAISAVPVYGFPATDAFFFGASPTTPDGRFGFGPFGNQLPDGNPGRLTWDPVLGEHRRFDPRHDGFNYATTNYLRTPYRRIALFAQGRLDFSPDLSLQANALLQQRDSAQELAPTSLFLGPFDGFAGISADNLYNPFGQRVTFLALRPLNRPRRFEQDVLTHYLAVTLSGAWTWRDRHYDWELSLIDGRTRQVDAIDGGYDLQRMARGLGPSFIDAGGNPRCGNTAAPIDDCVPLDFLHGRAGLTDAMYDTIAADGRIRQVRNLREYGLLASGPLLDLPGGEAAIAAGLVHRVERGRVQLDPLLSDDAFYFGGVPYEALSGETRVNEAFVELELPLLADKPWARSLSASLAARYSDYSSFGSTTNRKVRLTWRPNAEVLFRATWSQGFRAPSTEELFAFSGAFAGSDNFELDPCIREATARCIADGVPPDGFDPPIGPGVRFGSNPGLQPERTRNRAAGVVWSPARLPGLDLSLDWWRIELSDTIAALEPHEIAVLCYVDDIDSACRYLRRDPLSGVLLEIDARLQNFGRQSVEGWDLNLDYRWSGRWGDIGLRLASVYTSRNEIEFPKGSPLVSTVGNYYNGPVWRLRSVLSLDWQHEQWGATLHLRHYPALDEGCYVPYFAGDLSRCDRPDIESPTFDGFPEHEIDARTYTDLQLRWEPRAGARFSLGINNLFDLDPPVSYSGVANSYDPAYDIPGRFWYLSYRHRF